MTSITQFQLCLNHFCAASGLKANQEKSSIFFGSVTQLTSEEIVEKFGYSRGILPVKYLGVPLTTKKMSIAQWQPLIEKMVTRISSWTAKKLSYAGRIQLVQSVLFGIQAYWSQLFLIPSKVLKTIEAYCRSYVWSGVNVITRRSLASWVVRKMVEARSSVETILIQLQKNNSMIRQLYLAMMGQLPRVEWKMFMFGNEARAKAKFTMWLNFQDRMLTSDRLNKWGMQVDRECILCKVHDENRKHIFIECEYAKSVWTKLLKWMQRQLIWATSWDQHWKWAAENATGKSSKAGVFRMV
ncbi:PREDICTED: uncharacterized protein LOC109205855 [Nicotiana attenuata]|uniref:uncharacterized protein LOC109205855 n=1 Tax=Nicotiana attenuata TaxID=49451 RepID=UPI000904A844|nr:PREDICTED: uncharacterized protein LOC109205855 [Nicotiana attenuata]